jgi:hypothetical protein
MNRGLKKILPLPLGEGRGEGLRIVFCWLL